MTTTPTTERQNLLFLIAISKKLYERKGLIGMSYVIDKEPIITLFKELSEMSFAESETIVCHILGGIQERYERECSRNGDQPKHKPVSISPPPTVCSGITPRPPPVIGTPTVPRQSSTFTLNSLAMLDDAIAYANTPEPSPTHRGSPSSPEGVSSNPSKVFTVSRATDRPPRR